MKQGIRPEAVNDLQFLDLSEVQIETTDTGRVNIIGEDKFIERTKTLRPHWFGTTAAPNVNTATPGIVPGQQITLADVTAAEKEAKKTGDRSKYMQLVSQYQKQQH